MKTNSLREVERYVRRWKCVCGLELKVLYAAKLPGKLMGRGHARCPQGCLELQVDVVLVPDGAH